MTDKYLKVQFVEISDFLCELSRDMNLIDRKIVRIGKKYKTGQAHEMVNVYVYAVAIIGHSIVELEQFVGETWQVSAEHDKTIYQRANDVLDEVKRFCVAHELNVRAGTIYASAA